MNIKKSFLLITITIVLNTSPLFASQSIDLVGPKEPIVKGLVPQHKAICVTHCHILEHAEAGMMTAIGVNEQEL